MVFIWVCLVAQSCPTLCDPMDCSPPGSSVHGDSPGRKTGVGCCALLQGIFPTQESNWGLLHCRRILYQLSHQASPCSCGRKCICNWIIYNLSPSDPNAYYTSMYAAAAAKSLQLCPPPVWPHRWKLTRLPCPWDSPGENTGVGCHFLLQCMKVKSKSEVAQSCPTLSDPLDCSLPGSSSHGIFQARVLEWIISPREIRVHVKTFAVFLCLRSVGTSLMFSRGRLCAYNEGNTILILGHKTRSHMPHVQPKKRRRRRRRSNNVM